MSATAANADVKLPLLVDGALIAGRDGRWMPSLNPADEEVIGFSAAANAEDVALAVDAAQRAQASWAADGVAARAALLRLVAERLRQRSADIVALEVADCGNTERGVARDVLLAAASLERFAGLGYEIKGDTIPASADGLHFTIREPYGVVGRIVPFNHPILFAVARIAAPLMAGNTVVLKPAEQSPLSSLILAEIAAEVLPAGVLNIVPGLGEVAGESLVRHPAVRRIGFTGSVRAGRAIQRTAAESGVKVVTLELGGKNPLIALPDTDAATIAAAAVEGMNFGWQGQSCGSTSRLLLHDSLHDEVTERVIALVQTLRVGDPRDPATDMGPLISEAHLNKVLSYIRAGSADGATLAIGGERPAGSEFTRGFWVQPTVFTGVTAGMRIAREEIFGPVLSVLRWSDLDEAVALANDTEYGLAAAIWTNDLRAAMSCARRIKAGYVWINGVSKHFEATPFGGMKASGVGKEEGLEELLSYTEEKTVHVM